MLKKPVMTVWDFVADTTLIPSPTTPTLLFKSVQTVWLRIPRGLKKGKTHFPETVLSTVWHLGSFVNNKKKKACCCITACLCCHFPVLSLEIPPRKVQILIILLHADTFRTNQHCKHFVSIWTNYFFTTMVNKEGQYVMEKLLIYTGFVNDTDLLKYRCFICLFQPDSLWAEIGIMKSCRPTLMLYCKHANHTVSIINRNCSFSRLQLLPLIAFIYVKVAYKIRFNYS